MNHSSLFVHIFTLTHMRSLKVVQIGFLYWIKMVGKLIVSQSDKKTSGRRFLLLPNKTIFFVGSHPTKKMGVLQVNGTIKQMN